MKKQLNKLLLLFALFLVTGCHTGADFASNQTIKHYDLAIWTDSRIRTFSLTDGVLTPLETLKRKEQKHFSYLGFAEADDVYFTKMLNDPGLSDKVTSINKKTLEETSVPSWQGDAHAFTTDGQFLYGLAVRMGYLELAKYDHAGNVVHSTRLDSDEVEPVGHQFVVIGEDLYLLMGNKIRETGQLRTEIWKMTKQFVLLEKINPDEAWGYRGMVAVGNKLYLTKTFEDGQNGIGNGGNKLMLYDLDTGSKNYLYPNLSFPLWVRYDEQHHTLLIFNDTSYASSSDQQNFFFTLLSLDTGQETIIDFSDEQIDTIFPPFVTIKNGQYYFLFPDKLVQYDGKQLTKTVIDLSSYGITNAHALIVNN